MCPLNEHGKQLAVQVSNILGMDVCGIDLLQLNDGSFLVCEANANVGFIAFDQACGLDVAGIIADYALSLLPNRLSRKMSLLSVVSSASETSSEPEVCIPPEVCLPPGVCQPIPACTIPDAVSTMSTSSTSSESETELVEMAPSVPDPAYNINSLLTKDIKLLTEWASEKQQAHLNIYTHTHIHSYTLHVHISIQWSMLTHPKPPRWSDAVAWFDQCALQQVSQRGVLEMHPNRLNKLILPHTHNIKATFYPQLYNAVQCFMLGSHDEHRPKNLFNAITEHSLYTWFKMSAPYNTSAWARYWLTGKAVHIFLRQWNSPFVYRATMSLPCF